MPRKRRLVESQAAACGLLLELPPELLDQLVKSAYEP